MLNGGFAMQKYLEHHGIKGQEWGIRRGPPYPIDRNGDVRIKKGSSFNSVMTKKKIQDGTDHDIYVYDPSDSHDTAVYKGAYANQLLSQGRTNKVYDHKFTASEDLLIPSQKQKIDTFKELYKNDPLVRSDVEFRRRHFASHPVSKWWDKLDEDSSTRLDRDYRMFVTIPNHQADAAHKKFIEALRSKGYNAMFDDNDANQYVGAHNPLYVFSQKSLAHDKKATEIKKKEIRRHFNTLNTDTPKA